MKEVPDASNVNAGLQFFVHTYLPALGTLTDTAELWRPRGRPVSQCCCCAGGQKGGGFRGEGRKAEPRWEHYVLKSNVHAVCVWMWAGSHLQQPRFPAPQKRLLVERQGRGRRAQAGSDMEGRPGPAPQTWLLGKRRGWETGRSTWSLHSHIWRQPSSWHWPNVRPISQMECPDCVSVCRLLYNSIASVRPC